MRPLNDLSAPPQKPASPVWQAPDKRSMALVLLAAAVTGLIAGAITPKLFRTSATLAWVSSIKTFREAEPAIRSPVLFAEYAERNGLASSQVAGVLLRQLERGAERPVDFNVDFSLGRQDARSLREAREVAVAEPPKSSTDPTVSINVVTYGSSVAEVEALNELAVRYLGDALLRHQSRSWIETVKSTAEQELIAERLQIVRVEQTLELVEDLIGKLASSDRVASRDGAASQLLLSLPENLSSVDPLSGPISYLSQAQQRSALESVRSANQALLKKSRAQVARHLQSLDFAQSAHSKMRGARGFDDLATIAESIERFTASGSDRMTSLAQEEARLDNLLKWTAATAGIRRALGPESANRPSTVDISLSRTLAAAPAALLALVLGLAFVLRRKRHAMDSAAVRG